MDVSKKDSYPQQPSSRAIGSMEGYFCIQKSIIPGKGRK